MNFSNEYPTLAALLGKNTMEELDVHKMQLNGAKEHELEAHFKQCNVSALCCRFLNNDITKELDCLEFGLKKVADAIGEEKMKSAYSKKAKDPSQYPQFVAEVSVATRCAVFGTLLDLEYKTGVGTKDVDVRAQIGDEVVNIEVTLRTDNLLTSGEPEDVQATDDNGNPIPGMYFRMYPEMKRSTMTQSEKEVLEEAGHPVAGGATDNRSPYPEHIIIRRMIEEKSRKLARGEINLVALCVNGAASDESHVEKALYGSFTLRISRETGSCMGKVVAPGGLFVDRGKGILSGVLFIDTYNDLSYTMDRKDVKNCRNRLYPNPNALVPLTEKVISAIERVFDAKTCRCEQREL